MQLRLRHPLPPKGLEGAPETDIWLPKSPWHPPETMPDRTEGTAWPDCRTAFLVSYVSLLIKEELSL